MENEEYCPIQFMKDVVTDAIECTSQYTHRHGVVADVDSFLETLAADGFRIVHKEPTDAKD